jgi:hypothetical protein
MYKSLFSVNILDKYFFDNHVVTRCWICEIKKKNQNVNLAYITRDYYVPRSVSPKNVN